ncbi:tetratricopeptide repeat protein [Chitinophaga qingshengii]|uniref:Tetratricopeptide repeat protein n=1 Tax=Chitinophaga qingshengii TaxID=1569794 RepID=A0ABR7TU44_9BACT|nr:tetratricopeptide repeat protein [Chitinophaga qingshengii]MBC9933132.1 tetratricopeptide repeat protein [Chitinophaga qingshengii]
MRRLLHLTILLTFSLSAVAQQTYIDSLQQLLKQDPDAARTADIQQQIADAYRTNEKYPEAIRMAEQSLETSLKISGNNLGVTKAYWTLSNIYTNTEDFEKAQRYINQAYQSARAQSNPLPMAYAHYAEAMLHSTLYDNEKTVKSLHEALSRIPDPEKEPLLTARIYYLLYGVYSEWDNESETFHYARKALDFAVKSGNDNLLANAYAAMAVAYKTRQQRTHQEKDIDSSLSFLDKGIALYQANPGKVATNTYATLRINKASYLITFWGTKNPAVKRQIVENINETLNTAKAMEDNDRFVASSYGILSQLSLEDNNVKAAENYLLMAYTQMLQRKKPYYYTLANVAQDLARLYSRIGDYKKAYEFQEKLTQYKELLFNESEAESAKRLEAQYHLKNKDKELQAMMDKAASHKKQKNLLLGLIAAGIVGGFFMFRSYHYNLRYSLTREKQLRAEKNEAEMQVKLEKEEQGRLKAEQELLALQQQKLQDEVMANQLHLQRKIEVLQQLKEKLSGPDAVGIHQVLREESLMDDDFEKAKFQIQELHPNFFKNLNEKTRQKLTALDMKYCAYLYLGMDTKQIAQLLNVEPKSVRMTKYRLKQKFELDGETDLVVYLKAVG